MPREVDQRSERVLGGVWGSMPSRLSVASVVSKGWCAKHPSYDKDTVHSRRHQVGVELLRLSHILPRDTPGKLIQ